MAVYRRPARQRFVLLVVTLLSVTIITVDQRGPSSGLLGKVRNGVHDAIAPVQSAVDAVVSPVSDFFGGVFHYGSLKEENARLRDQLAEQQGATDRAASVERELKELSDLEGLPFVGNIPSVAARVVATSPSNFEATLTINKGTHDGVAKGMPVVAGEGLVGRIASVSRERSTIILVTDADSSVGVKLSTSGDVGVAQGRGAGASIAVGLIDPKTKVNKDEVVVTSGLQQSVFPPGIPIGKVRSARADPGALEQTVMLDPVVDLRRVTFVKVLQWSPS